MSQTEQNPTAGVARTSLSSATTAVSGIILAILIARRMGAYELGLYFFLLTVSLSIARIPTGIGRAIRQQIRQSKVDPTEFHGISLLTAILGIFTLIVISLIVTALYKPLLESHNITYLNFISVIVVTAGMGSFHLMHESYTAYNDSTWFKIFRQLATLGVQIQLILSGRGINSLLITYGAVALITAFALLVSKPSLAIPDPSAIKKVTKSSLITIPTAIASNYHHKADVLIIGVFTGMASVGLYEAALKLVIPAMVVSSSISGLMAVRLKDKQSGYQATELVKSAVTYSTLVAIPFIAIIGAISHETMWYVFSPEFGEAWLLLILLAFTQVLASVRTPLAMALRSVDKSRYVIGTRIATMLINIPLSIYFLMLFGVKGVVIATAGVEVFTFLIYYAFIRGNVTSTLRKGEIIKQLFSGGVVFGALYGLRKMGVFYNSLIFMGAVIGGVILFYVIYISLSQRTQRIIYDVMFD